MKLPGNMQGMMAQAQKMQAKLQEDIAAIRVEASAGGGMVTVKMDGQKRCLGVTIDPEAAEAWRGLGEAHGPRPAGAGAGGLPGERGPQRAVGAAAAPGGR